MARNPVDPHQSARQSARPVLRNRFYKQVATAESTEGFAVTLDGKQVRTPAGRVLLAPKAAIAEALRSEWDAQQPAVDPAKMPLTRLANSIVDGVAERPGETADDIVKYLGSDLLFYRADGPARLIDKQAAAWDPIIRWAASELGARFVLAEGIVHVRQPDHAIEAARKAVPTDPWTSRCIAFGHDADRLGAARARADARLCRCAGHLARGACRRGLEFRDLGF